MGHFIAVGEGPVHVKFKFQYCVGLYLRNKFPMMLQRGNKPESKSRSFIIIVISLIINNVLHDC